MRRKLLLNYRNIPNWGDQLNWYLAEKYFFKGIKIRRYHEQIPNESLRKKLSTILPYRWVFHENVQLIGSTIGFCNPETIVCGAGLISERMSKFLPKKILAVRGPMTAQLLRKKGLKVPEIYCDPGIFISDVYWPNIEKEFEYGIIPHYSELESVQKMFANSTNIRVLSVHDDIEQFCDKALACKRIVSSSLHGLIVADAYNIPSAWVTFGTKLIGDDFKFQDYFGSLRDKPIPLRTKIEEVTQINKLNFRLPSKPNIDQYLSQIGKIKLNIR
ncbi:MAG: polysaccharide pyruvyl transferase family protein [bacterium]|nr:polysaccharide pyruvyl transferase family protein [bacterium]